jgi:uncharacterized protein (DUF2062 family)
MAKKIFKRWLPDYETIKTHPSLQFLGKLLHDPNLWHINRRSLSGGMASGLFAAFVPLPMQMAIAALFAIIFRVNLPLGIALVWLTNPITVPPLYYLSYVIGCKLLSCPIDSLGSFEFSVEWITRLLETMWQPLLLGLFIVACLTAAAGYFLVQFFWRLHVRHAWRKRQAERLAKKAQMLNS